MGTLQGFAKAHPPRKVIGRSLESPAQRKAVGEDKDSNRRVYTAPLDPSFETSRPRSKTLVAQHLRLKLFAPTSSPPTLFTSTRVLTTLGACRTSPSLFCISASVTSFSRYYWLQRTCLAFFIGSDPRLSAFGPSIFPPQWQPHQCATKVPASFWI